jgi:hypothetical protein
MRSGFVDRFLEIAVAHRAPNLTRFKGSNQMVITTLKSPAFDTSTITEVTFIGGGTCTWTQDATGNLGRGRR